MLIDEIDGHAPSAESAKRDLTRVIFCPESE